MVFKKVNTADGNNFAAVASITLLLVDQGFQLLNSNEVT